MREKRRLREKLEKIAAIDAELRRRREAQRLRRYNKGVVHKKQMAFHREGARNRWVFGGNRTGKTECGAVEAVWFARGNHPYRAISGATRGWIVSPTLEVQRDVAQRKVLSYIDPRWIAGVSMRQGRKDDPQGGVIDSLYIRSVHGGVSVIGFKSCEMGRAKFQGTSLHWVWFDEEPPREIYEECRMRVLDTKGDIWGTMTPLLGLTWVHDEIYLNARKDPEIWHERIAWRDNPFLPREEIERLRSSMSGDEREAREHGRFLAPTGLVYQEFDEAIHVMEPFDVPVEWYAAVSIDPGLVAPLSCHFYACDGDGTVYVIAEHYRAGWTVEQHARRIREMAAEMGWPLDKQGRLRAIVDPAVGQRTLSSEKSAAELFYEHGILCDTSVNKNKWSGIQRVKQYLVLREAQDKAAYPHGKPRLFLFATCGEMISEIKTYRWADGDTPVKKDDHAMDDLRYFIMSGPRGAKEAKPEMTAIERDKARLARRGRAKRL